MHSGIPGCLKFAQVTSWCILDKRGKAKNTSRDFNCTWLDVNFELEQYLGERLMTFHKSTSTEKNTYWEMATGITVTPNYTHQIQLTWLLITATCHQSSRALYQCTPLEQSLSGLKHSMLTHLTFLLFVYSLIVSVFRSQISTAPVLHRLQASLLPLVPLDKVKDWLLTDKRLSRNFSIPDSLTWTCCIAPFPCHNSINRLLISLTSVSLSICWHEYSVFTHLFTFT